MKKIFFTCIIFTLLLAPLTVFAQDEAELEPLPACTTDQLAEAMTSFGDSMTEYGEMITLPEAPVAADFAAALAVTDAFATGYWEAMWETEMPCAEIYMMLYEAGFFFSETTITYAINALAVFEGEAGNADASAALFELATARAGMLTDRGLALTESMTSMMMGEATESAEMPSCSEEELAEVYEAIGVMAESYSELGAMLSEEDADVAAILTGLATLSGGFWTEVYVLVPNCVEAQDAAFTWGMILDESLTAVALLQVSSYVEESDPELAQVLSDSGLAHLDYVTALSEEFMGAEEE